MDANKSAPEQTKKPKPIKHKPKRDKMCVGQFLARLYAYMNDILKKENATKEEKEAAAWAMNCTMMEIMGAWCKCGWCKRAEERVQAILNRKKE